MLLNPPADFLRRFGLVACLALVIMSLWVEVSGGASSLTLTDKLGRTITVQVPIKRAVVVITYELIPALGIWDQVAGVSRWAEKECDIYKAIIERWPHLKKPHVGTGTDVNIESVMVLNPDLVITWSYNSSVINFMENKGIKVYSLYPENLKELYDVIRVHGVLFGKVDRAEEIVTEVEKILKLIKGRVDEIQPEKRLKVVHLLSKPTTVSGAIGITNDLIEVIGAVNIGGEMRERNADVSVERIVKWNPDVIFIWGNAGYGPERILNNSQWQSIRAVQNGYVYKLPKWSTWSPRIAIVALWMAMKVYPERFYDVYFQEVAESFYTKIFGISYSQVVNK
ncbi:MAG: ABC transporter substrate-binding protein [Syntrophobacterales bacterium]|nr:ABC transporter substrate-binding protein [Syntrophobacterales bacterium]